MTAAHDVDHIRQRHSCDERVLAAYTRPNSSSDSDSDVESVDPEGQDVAASNISQGHSASFTLRSRQAFFIRTLALLCVCSLSIGSHYGSYILGPLKSRLAREIGTSHTDFGLLMAAFSLNSTWTPLIGGILASTLGTSLTSILATGVILLGQLLLLLGDIYENVRLMALGLFIFGLGVSPLAVVQETIIVRFFRLHGLGVSMAFGLVAGKSASFVAARTSYPLTERFGPRAPFYVATLLAGLSVVINLVYIAASKWFVYGAGAELETATDTAEAQSRMASSVSEAQARKKVAAKRRVNLHQITKLGDIFWAYIGLNVLCGMIWSPFTHLAANIIQTRYPMTERDAARQASYLLAGSLILYPICGFLLDRFKHRPIVVQLLLASSCLTLSAYVWLALPPIWTQIPGPSIFLFATGHGFAPLLLVVIVPKIVPLKYVSTALGAHKSLEQTGSALFQTLAGLALDTRKNVVRRSSETALQHLLNILLILNVVQLSSVIGLADLQKRKGQASTVQKQIHASSQREEQPLISPLESHSRHMSTESRSVDDTRREVRRGRIFASLSAASIAFAWILFLGTAWFRLGKGR